MNSQVENELNTLRLQNNQLQIDLANALKQQDTPKLNLSRGDKIQRYSQDGKTLIKTYSGAVEAMRDPDVPDIARPILMQSIVAKTVYKNFRWAALTRDHEDTTFQDIGETIKSKTVKKGFVAMLNLPKTQIVQVFCDQKEASEDRQFKTCAAISKAIKLDSQSGGHYFKMWIDCDQALQDAYLATHELPTKRVKPNGKEVNQLNPITGDLVTKYSSVEDVIRVMKISRITLDSAIANQNIVKGFKWGLVS